MNLYIEIDNGQPINHPAFEDNLLEVFGQIPSNWEPFVRVVKPTLGVYQVFEDIELTYEKVDGVWTDVWHYRNMTEAEKAEKIRLEMLEQPFNSWLFNEELCTWESPVSVPADGKPYEWNEESSSWLEIVFSA